MTKSYKHLSLLLYIVIIIIGVLYFYFVEYDKQINPEMYKSKVNFIKATPSISYKSDLDNLPAGCRKFDVPFDPSNYNPHKNKYGFRCLMLMFHA